MIPSGLQEVLARISQLQATFGGLASTGHAASSGGFQAAMEHASRTNGLDPALVKAVIQAESGGDARAVSSKGAAGLMQLMPETARDMGVQDPLDPEQNVAGGTRYLRQMLDRFGGLPEALAAYNAGPRAVEKSHGIPPFSETRHYVDHVLDLYRQNQEGGK